MDASLAISILGIYLTITSLLLIYEVLQLQIWVEAVDNIYNEVKNNDKKYMGATNRAPRQKCDQECKNLAKKYPSLISYLILLFVAILSVLGIYLSYMIRKSVCMCFTAVPVGTFLVIIILVNCIFIKNRKSKLKEIQSLLEKWNE